METQEIASSLDTFISDLQNGEKLKVIDTNDFRLLVSEKGNQVFKIKRGVGITVETPTTTAPLN